MGEEGEVEIVDCGLRIQEEEKINRQAAKHAKGRKKRRSGIPGSSGFPA
jgi:hypothetical protein